VARRLRAPGWSRLFARSLKAITRSAARSGTRAPPRAAKPKPAARSVAASAGLWLGGVAAGGLAPAIAVWVGWQWALAVNALVPRSRVAP